ncbi:MAG: InlB B-repeat-containing protein [Clostridia bacterium]|nr:InlB B-repeat-containing protein [Clostridia bacterium]
MAESKFTKRRLGVFLFVLIFLSAVAVGAAIWARIYIGYNGGGDDPDMGLEEKLTLGSEFSIDEVKAYKDVDYLWLNEPDNIVEIYHLNEDNTYELSDQYLSYDGNTRTFKVLGVGKSKVIMKHKVDTTIDFEVELSTRFNSNDTISIIQNNYPSLLSDSSVSMTELGEIESLLFSNVEVLDISDVRYFTQLERIDLKNSSTTKDVSFTGFVLPSQTCIYVSATKYKDYLKSDDDGWKANIDKVFVHTSTADEISVIFHKDGGKLGFDTGLDHETLSLTKGSQLNISSDFSIEKTGYTFLGWYASTDNGTTVQVDDVFTFNKNTKVFARWEPYTYSVKLHLNDGTSEKIVDTFVYDDKKPICSNPPSYSGYTQLGWAYDKNATVADFDVQEDVLNLTDSNNAIIDLYAVWASNTFKVEFYNKDHLLGFDNYMLGDSVQIKWSTKPSDPDNKGDFLGWAFSPDAPFLEYYDGDIAHGLYATPVTNNTVRVYAIYSYSSYTINFDANGASDIISSMENVQKGIDVTLPSCDDRFGYKFRGWMDVATSFVYTSNEEYYNAMNVGENEGKYFYTKASLLDDGFITTSGTVNLAAVWEANSFTITFNNANATEAFQSLRVYFGKDAVLTGRMTRTGYHHDDNFTHTGHDYSFKITNNTIAEKAIADLYKLLLGQGKNNDFYSESAELIITPKWVPNTYTISYSASGASNVPESQLATYDQEIHISSNTPTKSGYTFTHWSYGSSTYSPNQTVLNLAESGVVTLEAVWQQNQSSGGGGGGGCMPFDSLITLANGSTIMVKDLVVGQEVLAFDHATGNVTSAPVSVIYKDTPAMHRVLTLYFACGTEFSLINEHGLFDCTLNEYIMIDEFNVESLVGHSFFYTEIIDGQAVSQKTELVSYNISMKETARYAVITAKEINHYTGGLLTMCDEIDGLYNVFELNQDMAYDMDKLQSDIATYGLASYDEWSEYLTEEEFYAFNGQYINVAIGKGLTTREYVINHLINYYLRGAY